jgi:predicted RNA-binding protein associated with RNAse of E/G family
VDVRINYRRLTRGISIYLEGIEADDGRRLTTYSVVPEAERSQLAEGFWRQQLLPSGTLLSAVRKHYFYTEYFDVLAFYGLDGDLAGYYCDIVTPLQKVGAEYFLTDLFLDFWLAPGQPPRALDLDEFEAGVAQGLMAEDQVVHARQTFARLQTEIQAGIFPNRYIGT